MDQYSYPHHHGEDNALFNWWRGAGIYFHFFWPYLLAVILIIAFNVVIILITLKGIQLIMKFFMPAIAAYFWEPKNTNNITGKEQDLIHRLVSGNTSEDEKIRLLRTCCKNIVRGFTQCSNLVHGNGAVMGDEAVLPKSAISQTLIDDVLTGPWTSELKEKLLLDYSMWFVKYVNQKRESASETGNEDNDESERRSLPPRTTMGKIKDNMKKLCGMVVEMALRTLRFWSPADLVR